MNDAPFGSRAREAKSSAELLALEAAEERSDRFVTVDAAISGILGFMMRGRRVVHLETTDRGDVLAIVGIPETMKASLSQMFHPAAQQAHGAWFIPSEVRINARSLVLPSLLREAPRYAHTLAAEDKGDFLLDRNPDALLVWSVLEPLADALFEPIWLRVEGAGLLSQDEFASRWTAIEGRFAEIGLDIVDELRPFSWGGWAKLSAEAQLASKARLIDAMATRLTVDVVRRHRAACVLGLVTRYYAKAKHGRARRKQVITGGHVRPLSGFFGGDWLAFVRYLGEQPHDEERVVTAQPEPKIIVGGRSRAAELAAKKGIPVREAERILGAFWNDASANSPVLDRVDTLTAYWRAFDALHARQEPGMTSLLGLVEEFPWQLYKSFASDPEAELYRRLLPADLVMHIDSLWGTHVLARCPDRIVTEPWPHKAMAEVFGTALKFWHACALTAWYVCEGPRSRTDIPGLASYHRRDLIALQDVGCPVTPQFFEELCEVRLGPEETIHANESEIDIGYGMSIQMGMAMGSRRSGFERLRDVITHHRRQWAERYLDIYLRGRWETEIKAAARQLHLMTEDRGKPPTLKQFAGYAVKPASRWFGGDVGLLYASLGQKLPGGEVRRSLQMPNDRRAFVTDVFLRLGGIVDLPTGESEPEASEERVALRNRNDALARLADFSLVYVQYMEALGRAPPRKEFGVPLEVLAAEEEAAWHTYSRAVEQALAQVHRQHPG